MAAFSGSLASQPVTSAWVEIGAPWSAALSAPALEAQPAGPVERLRSNFISGIKRLPVQVAWA